MQAKASFAESTPRYFDPELRISAPQLGGLPRLRILTSLDFPPFNFADANKRPTRHECGAGARHL